MSKIIETSLIGETIKQLRLSRHWTQEDLADRTFYSVRNIRRIENEGTRSIDVVNTFAELFGVSALDILNGVSFLEIINYQSCQSLLLIISINFFATSSTFVFSEIVIAFIVVFLVGVNLYLS